MIKSVLWISVLILYYTSTISATDVNGRFVITNTDSSKLAVLLQINTSTGTDAMGGATIVIGFDTATISIKANPVKNLDYFYHNFCGGNYSPATVTRPMKNRVWINIDLPYSFSNMGTLVSDTSGWTDIVTIYFDITDPNGMASIFWIPTSLYWGIYDDDNITLWNTGQFLNQLNFPLPVELGSFNATLLDNKNVLLRWSTVSSVNSYGFEIEKSQKSKVKSQNEWEKIGFVESLGNSNTIIEYSFTDLTPHYTRLINYRLKMIDNDGSFKYSDVVEVDAGPVTFELKQNYPNPFNPVTVIGYQLSVDGIVNLKVYDVLGNEIATLADEFREAGYHTIDFNAAGLASGVYFYRLIAGGSSTGSGHNFVETKKMILLR